MNWYKYSKIKFNSFFVGSYLPDDFYDKYSHIKGLEEDIHLTLFHVFFEDNEENRKKILELVNNLADKFPHINCEVAGISIMNNDKNALILNIDAKGTEIFHVDLLRLLDENNIEIKRKHGFLPHVTLKYDSGNNKLDIDKNIIKDYAWAIKNISVIFNKEDDMVFEFQLKGGNKDELV